jgi:hypothetical protein
MKDKRLEVARYQLRQHALSRWLSLVFPGAGHVHRAHVKEGFLYLFLGALFLMKAALWNGFIPDPMDLKVSSSIPWVVLFLYFFLVYYVWVQVRMSRILRREVKFYFRPAE